MVFELHVRFEKKMQLFMFFFLIHLLKYTNVQNIPVNINLSVSKTLVKKTNK